MHFFIKRPKMTKWAGVLSIPKAGTYVQLWQWRPTENAATVCLLTPLRNEQERRTKDAYELRAIVCIFQYVIGYGGRNRPSLIDLFMFTMIRFKFSFITCPRNAEHYEAPQGYASYPPYLHVCVCVNDILCVCE